MDLDQLAARVAALEAEVETLRRRALTMKQTYRCACGGTTLLHFKRVFETGHGKHHELSLINNVNVWSGSTSTHAPLEAFACVACGLVEWHAVTLAGVVVDGEYVERLSAPTESEVGDAPYR
jgi:hypothetical protein